ncbi:MAG TPA: XRE family transcriptional regulator [Chloroflexi bacterium]|nr:XRE family transcriptional regulator [Chloroflexota bacterium]
MLPDLQELIRVRNRILGVLLKDARKAAGREQSECAELLGIPEEEYRAFEMGRQSPTLPQLEVLAYFFNVPIGHFWGTETLAAERREDTIKERVPELLMLRQRIIGLRLHQLRREADMTLEQAAERSGLDPHQIEAVERGETTLPVSELETLARAVRGRIEDLVDGHGPIGSWIQAQEQFEDFVRLPADLREFILRPVNRSYLELAVRLSQMDVDRLRTIAESILEITY